LILAIIGEKVDVVEGVQELAAQLEKEQWKSDWELYVS